MTLYDFYDGIEYNQIFYDCKREIQRCRDLNDPLDFFEALLDFSCSDRQFRKDFPIDKNGCLFFLLSVYATSKEKRNRILDMAQVYFIETKGRIKFISTSLGDADFELYIKNYLDIIFRYYESGPRNIQTLFDLYQGKLFRFCHYSVAELGKNYNIVGAFVPGRFADHRYIHSYLEKNGRIFDVSNNLVMSKDDYYSLLSPEEVLTMSGEELFCMFQDSSEHEIEDVYLEHLHKVLSKKF